LNNVAPTGRFDGLDHHFGHTAFRPNPPYPPFPLMSLQDNVWLGGLLELISCNGHIRARESASWRDAV
jgi:hypothetical protein